MRKLLPALFLMFLLVPLCACGSEINNVANTVDCGQSSLYTREDAAIGAVKKAFNKWDTKCTLLSVCYAGDIACKSGGARVVLTYGYA